MPDKEPIEWKVQARMGEARAGILQTRRAKIETPVFMPVGTLGTVKGVRFEALESDELDARIILGNTYHLWLRPGSEIIKEHGGLHRFIGWQRALVTDSGGFQVWSLGTLRKISEEGVAFRSHLDGNPCFLSPEISMQVQADLNSDIVMGFDECLSGEASYETAKQSLEMTARWMQRSRTKFNELQGERDERDECADLIADPDPNQLRALSGQQALFGIVQGATYIDLRRESLARTVDIGFDGYALGGLSVGEEKSKMYETVERIAPLMPQDKPRYLMGVGMPEDLIECVARGIDMFDCVIPTRTARNGLAWTSRGKLNIRLARWARDARPLDEACRCSVCRRHCRGYLRHLYIAGEMLAGILLTHHNLAFFLDTMRCVRQAIVSENFVRFQQDYLRTISSGVE
ncbi:MAG: tRNA guanosine(34) transglycosylase Tgt [Pyrinomonadaceae bacterium]